jgi:hypothetical protein
LLSTKFRFDSEKQAPFHAGDLLTALADPLDLNDRVNVRAEAMNIYIFIPYLPGAAGIALGRALHLSALALLYCTRFSNLAVFVALVLLAFRLLPDFRPALLGLALMPTSLHQAASASLGRLLLRLGVPVSRLYPSAHVRQRSRASAA